VLCGPQARNDTVTREPVVVAEVPLPGTDVLARGRKWGGCQKLASLRHYVLIEQNTPVVEVYARHADGEPWRYERLEGLDATPALPAVDAAVPLAEVFEDAL